MRMIEGTARTTKAVQPLRARGRPDAALRESARLRATDLYAQSQRFSSGGDLWMAELAAHDCVDVARQSGDRRCVARALIRLGTTLLDTHTEAGAEALAEALAICRDDNDDAGHAHCLIHLGALRADSGETLVAENEFRVATQLARDTGATEIVGLAQLHAAILYQRTGRPECAGEPLDQALAAFRATGHEGGMAAVAYHHAHLSREWGDTDSARAEYELVVELAQRLEIPHLELGARAGAALCALAVDESAYARMQLAAADQTVADRSSWILSGRELKDAVAVSLAITRDGADAARSYLMRALPNLRCAYAKAWLLAECARPLARAGAPVTRSILMHHRGVAEERGFRAVARRLMSAVNPNGRPSMAGGASGSSPESACGQSCEHIPLA